MRMWLICFGCRDDFVISRMIAQFIKERMAQAGISSADLSSATGVPKEDIDLLLNGKAFLSVLRAADLLRYFGAELAASSGGELWAEGKWQPMGVQENLFELFRSTAPGLRKPGQMGTGPLAYLLHYLDDSNLEQTKEQLIRGIEYYEPRVTILDLRIISSGDPWEIHLSYFENQGKSKGNYIIPCPKPMAGSELPETTRRKAFERYVQDGKNGQVAEVIDWARAILGRRSDDSEELGMILRRLESIDASEIGELQQELIADLIAGVRTAMECR